MGTSTDGPSMTHVECGRGHLRLVPTLDIGTCGWCAVLAELASLRERLARLETGLREFIEKRGRHDGDHDSAARSCSRCDMSYIIAEGRLDRLVTQQCDFSIGPDEPEEFGR